MTQLGGAQLIWHCSDKTLPLLAKAVCHTIIEYAKGTTQALEDPSISWTSESTHSPSRLC